MEDFEKRLKNSKKINQAKLLSSLIIDPISRFHYELEFVEMLANPWYLAHLTREKYFEDPNFLRYLTYLQYWHKPEYIRHISHPHCLYFLEKLQIKDFRDKLSDSRYIALIHNNQYWHWMHYRRNRNLDLQAELSESTFKKIKTS